MQSEIADRSRICLVIPYFGRLPSFFELTLRSMEHNPSIDWLLVTDQPIREHSPNVRVMQMTFEQMRKRVQSSYSFPITLEFPYKLCDYKPAYGDIFSAELEGYDFWGHCDLDAIYGDIRATLRQDVLNLFDKHFMYGWFSLYRNSNEANMWYRHELPGLSYKTVFTSDAIHNFDEWAGMYRIVEDLEVPLWDDSLHLFDVHPYRFLPRDWRSPFGKVAYRWKSGSLSEVNLVTGSERPGLILHIQKRELKAPARDVLDDIGFWLRPDRFVPLADGGEYNPTRSEHLLAWTEYERVRARRWLARARTRIGHASL